MSATPGPTNFDTSPFDIEAALEFLIDTERRVQDPDPYDEDGYCEFCGNGRWKFHAPWCLWQEARDLGVIS